MKPLVIYVRVSTEEQDTFEAQEAAARDWAARAGEDVWFDPEACSEKQSAGGDVDDRKLGALIKRCEDGEFAGIIVRDESRFARDTIAGGVALRKLHERGARLIATRSGFDSAHLTPDKELVFNIMMSVGQAERKRNRGSRMGGKLKRAREGEWVSIPPFGYDRDELTRRLVPNDDAATVREIFRLRAEGVGFSELAQRFPHISRSGIRKIVMNRAYLGEQRVPDPDKPKGSELIVLRNNQEPLVTEPEWEGANAVQGHAPKHNGLAATTLLSGVVRCGLCQAKMFVLAYGKERDRKTYACTACGRSSMAVSKVEPAVIAQLDKAMLGRDKNPYVVAVLEGDTRYDDALAAVHQAQAEVSAWRDEISVTDVGIDGWKAGLQARQAKLETARRALRELPRPKRREITAATLEQAGHDDLRDFYARVIAEVRVYPRANGDRLTMRWQGAEDAFVVPEFKPAPLLEAQAA